MKGWSVGKYIPNRSEDYDNDGCTGYEINIPNHDAAIVVWADEDKVDLSLDRANLIAAAPDMLTALEELLIEAKDYVVCIDYERGECKGHAGFESNKSWPNEIVKALTAINKAKGLNK
tara:strand:- start:13 stop:366 length:354 start_codon:yes stop_codon:yes gene_type:complete